MPVATAATAATDVAVDARRTDAAERTPVITEDWLAVLLGAVLLALVLAGMRPSMPSFTWGAETSPAGILLSPDNLGHALQTGALVLIPLVAGAAVLRLRLAAFVPAVAVLYLLAWVAQAISGHVVATTWGFEYVISGLAIGLLISHLVPLPSWFREAVRTEYYIKTGLVVLGASILFSDVVSAGLLGMAQALMVVLSVWTFCFWLARRLGVDDEFAAMLSSAVSICGVSAAIATCGAIQGDRRKLSYVTSLVLVVAMPMLVVMPWIARATGMPEVMAGAWLGGTLDTSPAVVAGGEILGDAARNAAVVVKLSQNALIGFAAFFLTIWWALRGRMVDQPNAGIRVIWDRFPKFVLGFLLVSLVFSFLLSGALVNETRGLITGIRTTLFAMAFVSIGLETSLTRLVRTGGGRPAFAFLGGQAFNILVTLLVAYLLFGGVLVEVPRFD